MIGTSLFKPSQQSWLGKSNLISLVPITKEQKKRINKKLLFLTFRRSKPRREHATKKCSIPKKIKLVLFKKNVIDVIKKQTEINTPMRFKNFILKLSERLANLNDMPEIMIKLAPIH